MKKCILYRIVRPLLKIYLAIFYKPTIEGKENIPTTGPVVLCGNHTNYLDPLLLGSATKRTIRFLAKNELHKGFKKIFFESVGTIPVDRKNKDTFALKCAVEALNNNELIGIFPEGTINRTNDIIMPFKYGAVSMASKSNATIVPFAITGKYKKFKKNVKLTIGKPYKIEDINNLEKENKRLMKKVTDLIKKNGVHNER